MERVGVGLGREWAAVTRTPRLSSPPPPLSSSPLFSCTLHTVWLRFMVPTTTPPSTDLGLR